MKKEALFLGFANNRAVVSLAGRKLYRHTSGKGTVLEFNDGQDRRVLVLDARYRAKELITTTDETTDTSLPNYVGSNSNGSWYIDGGENDTSPSRCVEVTDEMLNSLWPVDPNTSKHNTDVWLTLPNCESAVYCRTIMVDGVGCDVPNYQTLMRLFCEATTIDSLDPTLKQYPELSLSDWLGVYSVHSSTEASSSLIRGIGKEGWCANSSKSLGEGVCPVLELG